MFLTDCVFPVLDQTLCTVNNMENAISNLTNNTYPEEADNQFTDCLLYTSDAADE